MSVSDDSAVYQSAAKFPHLIVVHLLSGGYRGQLDRVATLFVRCHLLYWSVYRDSRGHVAESPSVAARVSGLYRDLQDRVANIVRYSSVCLCSIVYTRDRRARPVWGRAGCVRVFAVRQKGTHPQAARPRNP